VAKQIPASLVYDRRPPREKLEEYAAKIRGSLRM